MMRATSVDPVNATPATRRSAVSIAPTLPSPGTRPSTSPGTPAECKSLTVSKAIRGVCSAGLATTQLPAASAPAICPVKIANGKFHGLMQMKIPRPRMRNSLLSPVGLGNDLDTSVRRASLA